MDIFFNYLIIIYYIGEYAKCGIIRRISGAEQQYSLSRKPKLSMIERGHQMDG